VRVASLAITTFRNISGARFELPAAGMTVVGRNGQGKTNFLEALYYLHLLRSFRGSRDADVAQFGSAGFHVRALATGTPRGVGELGIGFERASRRKKVLVNGVPPGRLSEAYGAVPGVLCSPDDREIVAGAPAARRHYLDVMLATVIPGYLFALQQYRGALQQRNAALRQPQSGDAEGALAAWEPALSAHGAFIIRARQEWAARSATEFARLCAAIGEEQEVDLSYVSRVHGDDLREALRVRFEETRGADLRRGFTHSGPHREEIRLTLADREFRDFGSAGQQRTAALALRMLEAATMRDSLGAHPLLLLDDPFAELDRERASRILDLLRGIDPGQVILCVPREDDIPAELSDLARWRVENGVIAQDFR
jgi:DNA replication and repair protein RecF